MTRADGMSQRTRRRFLVETAALAGKSKFTIRRKQIVFEVDARVRTQPKFDLHLR